MTTNKETLKKKHKTDTWFFDFSCDEIQVIDNGRGISSEDFEKAHMMTAVNSYCWWFRNPKANHLGKSGCFWNPVNHGICDPNLNWCSRRISEGGFKACDLQDTSICRFELLGIVFFFGRKKHHFFKQILVSEVKWNFKTCGDVFFFQNSFLKHFHFHFFLGDWIPDLVSSFFDSTTRRLESRGRTPKRIAPILPIFPKNQWIWSLQWRRVWTSNAVGQRVRVIKK